MALKLSLKPDEAVIVNGAVLRNGDRRAQLLLENHARVLREKDIVSPDSIRSPLDRAYFCVMQIYLHNVQSGPVFDQAIEALNALSSVPHIDRDVLVEASAKLLSGDVYRALVCCRKLAKSQSLEVVPEHA